MNKQRITKLVDTVRGRLNAFHSTAPAESPGLRVKASDTAATKMYLYDVIGGWDGITASDVVRNLAGVTGALDVHINSGGGDIFEGVAIHNALKNHQGDVTVHIDGVAASAASFIAMAGDRIVMEANATMMIHDAWTVVVGNAAEMREAADLLDLLSDTIAEMYAKKTGDTTESWRTKMQGEVWYSADQAVAAGLADEKVSDAKASNKLDLSLFNYTSTGASAPVVPRANAATDVAGFAELLKELKFA